MTDKRVGIITFHHSYNCGSMLQAFALQSVIEQLGYEAEIIDFLNAGQKQLYSVTQPNNSIKNILKNIILFPYKARIKKNFDSFEEFKNTEFHLSPESYSRMKQLTDSRYFSVVTGSDQVWNITIEDGDDAYYLPWVKKARKVAYAPSFGAKNVMKYADNPEKYKTYLSDFKALSIREENGKRWIKDLVGKDVPVLLDPTLLLDASAYDRIADKSLNLPDKYIFFYSPSYQKDIVHLVECVSKKYHLPVIAFNTKTFYVKGMQRTGFKLPESENPRSYLTLIKNATLIMTTSFHGTVFSTIFRKRVWVIKNGGMFGDDDRVKTLIKELGIEDRLIPIEYKEYFNYMKMVDYSYYNKELPILQNMAIQYLKDSLDTTNEE